MTVEFDHRAIGTPEEDWARAALWDGAPAFLLDADHLVVVAAHPDDETLGAGGLLWIAARRGIPVSVIVVTDGERSHPSASADLARRRRRELLDAVDDLTGGCAVHFLGLPDGGVRESVAELRRALRGLLTFDPAVRSTIVTPWWGDGHRDHRVVGEVVVEVAQLGGRVLGYPIWLWHWGHPDDIDASAWRVLALDDAAREAKARALRRHVTQIAPVAEAPGDGVMLHEEMLRHFEREFEVFIEAETSVPASTPVADFDARYARNDDPWGVDARWYERRKRELVLAVLSRERFVRALEIGCGTGALTQRLAGRCDQVVAFDVSSRAVARTRARVGETAGVSIEERDARDALPAGPFDLVVLSELAYYWSTSDLAAVVRSIDDVLACDGMLVLCHWRHPISDAPLTGDAVHALVAASGHFASLSRLVEEDVVIEVLVRSAADLSIAHETGIIP